MTSRKWVINGAERDTAAALRAESGFLPLTARLLCSRGLDTAEKVADFYDTSRLSFYDPYLLKDMDKAVARIREAIEKKERVCIYGDYDVDGVTSTTLLYTYLSSLGVETSYFIPERMNEGYGLSCSAIERFAGNVDLLITVDTGITAVAETEYAKQFGMDMIITDHHSCRDILPDAVAVVNPHREDCQYPFKKLAGVGVVFKLLCALHGNSEDICARYGEIVAIGTIADVMPIVGENRLIAAIGIENLANTKYHGLRALMEQVGIFKNGKKIKKITSSTIGYVLAPRINAAGRITSAVRAVELLLADNEADATRIASELCEINKLRQSTELDIYNQALIQIADQQADKTAFVLSSDGWHQGVIGVVASRITEKYSLPSVLFSFDGDIGKGSGRSIKGFSLMDALAYCSDLLLEYGGHELAAGLSIERKNLPDFIERLNTYAQQHIKKNELVIPLEIDCEASFNELTLRQAEDIQRLEPFGLSNPVPVFILNGATVKGVTPLSGGKHMKIRVSDGGRNEITAVYFGMSAESFSFCEGDKCDIAFSLEINEFMGTSAPQLLVKGMRLSEGESDAQEEMYKAYLKAVDTKNTEKVDASLIPTLTDFREVFRYLRRSTDGNKPISLRRLASGINEDTGNDINVCKILIISDVLQEQGIADVEHIPDMLIRIALKPFSGKINLDNSALLSRIKAKQSQM
ncbi:MAG: single-stranded-DNA-specific exonuclease RecJ [Clostridia bacterium]|nr:single-stranded-DNA-specific exonuclease RecJ [Clostridia bacterium]